MAFNENGWRLIDETGFIEGEEPNGIRRKYAYVTNDTKATVEGTGYFNDHINDLRIGDGIEVYGDLDGTPFHIIYVVNSVTTNVGITAAANLTYNAKFPLVVDIADLSADTSYYVVSPVAANIEKIHSVIDGAVSTADVTITAKIATVAVTDGAITIAHNGSAAGDVDSVTPSAANAVTAGQAIELAVAGGGAGGSPRGHVTLWMAPT